VSDLVPGSSFGPYRIESLLGRGGMSVVYLAEDTRLARRVAIKVLAPELAADDAFRSRFVRESQLAAGLDHPNIVPVFEAGEAEGQLFIAMRYVRGTDLRTIIVREGPLDPARTMRLLQPIASALDAAHRRELVHRDVKPANILIASDEGEEHVYLSDFGLTKHASSRSGLTRTGQFMGTVDYVAPEQIQGQDVDGRADEYSLACVLYECLTANVPYAKDSDVATLFGHIQDPPPRVSVARPTVPAAMDDVVAQGMAKDPADRFGTCVALLAAAAHALGEPSTPSDPPADRPAAPYVPPLGVPVPRPDAPSPRGPVGTPPGSPPPPFEPPATPPGPTPAPAGAPVAVGAPPSSDPSAPRGTGSNNRTIAMFAAGGLALAVVIVVIGLALTGGDSGGGGGGGPTGARTTSPTGPPPPVVEANAAPIRIVDAESAVPYPSGVDVSAPSGTVADVNVTVTGFGHAFPDDVAILLVGPSGDSTVLMSDVGGGSENVVNGVDLTFDDDASRGLADKGALRTGSFRPTQGTDKGGGNCCGFTGGPPAPRQPYGSDLSVFEGTDPNGEWDLYVADDSGGDKGRITGGWSLEIELGNGRPTTGSTGSTTGATSATGSTGATGSSGAPGFSAVFRDDFSDPTSGWDVFDDGSQSGGYADGEYVLSVGGGFQVTGDLITPTQDLSEFGDVRVEVTSRLLTAPKAVAGVTCRAQSPNSYYYFLVQGDGSYYIGEAHPRQAENLDTGTSPAIATGRAPNRIAAECLDSQNGVALRLIVNGVAVNTVEDRVDPLGPGSTGVRTESRNDPMSAAFDDYVVSVPS
jgi:serine/threonine protein kinase